MENQRRRLILPYTALTVSMIANLIFTGVILKGSQRLMLSPKQLNNTNITDKTQTEFNVTREINISQILTDLPETYSCLTDYRKFNLKNNIYAKLCYLPQIHQTIIDINFLKFGNVSKSDLMKILKSRLLSDNV